MSPIVEYIHELEAENEGLRAELEAARRMQLLIAERVAICSELLSRCAEKRK